MKLGCTDGIGTVAEAKCGAEYIGAKLLGLRTLVGIIIDIDEVLDCVGATKAWSPFTYELSGFEANGLTPFDENAEEEKDG